MAPGGLVAGAFRPAFSCQPILADAFPSGFWSMLLAALAGAVIVWAVQQILPSKREMRQIEPTPLPVVIERALEEKFVTVQSCKTSRLDTHLRIVALEDNHKALETKIEDFAKRVEDKGEERARRIYERMDAMGSEIRSELNGQTTQLINIIRNKR